jgi:hypothetical protein
MIEVASSEKLDWAGPPLLGVSVPAPCGHAMIV